MPSQHIGNLTGIHDQQMPRSILRQEIKLFQRFQDEWEFINQDEYKALNLELETETKNDIISFCSFQPQKYQPRDDYKEFLKLAMITLGAIIKLQSYHFIEKGNLFAEDRIV